MPDRLIPRPGWELAIDRKTLTGRRGLTSTRSRPRSVGASLRAAPCRRTRQRPETHGRVVPAPTPLRPRPPTDR